MDQKWIVPWSDKFVSGNKEIDSYHKKILDDVAKLYEMLKDSGKFKEGISILTREIEEELFAHMDIEVCSFKKFNLVGWDEHEKDHKNYRDKFDFYNKNAMPVIIRAVLTGEIALDYMNVHFPRFDAKDMANLNKAIIEAGEIDD